ncbi:MAG TPA: hypothetical protein PK413_06085 [Thermoanaerobaculia bacterium]|nr:hypothetical protein [Thermoanaerobaculia bacterium]
MATVSLRAHYDGERIQLDEPYALEPDTPLLVTVLPPAPGDSEAVAWSRLGLSRLAAAYGEDEPEYGPGDVRD